MIWEPTRTVAEKLELEHQVCQFHVRRWVGKALYDLKEQVPEEWLWVLEEVKELPGELALTGNRRLFALWKQISQRSAARDQPLTPLEQLRHLLIRLSEHWPNSGCLTGNRTCPGPIMAPNRGLGA